MARSEFVESAHSSPLPNVREHVHTYNCHMAVLNWALQSLGRRQYEAVLTVDRLAALYCRMCAGDFNFHQTLAADAYEDRFCSTKQHLLRDRPFDEQISDGDVVLIGVPGFLTHSMVAVRVQADEIYVRGFNNAGSFAEAVNLRSQYDPSDRALTKSNYWADQEDAYWHVSYDHFVRSLDSLLKIENTVRDWMA